MLAYLEEEEAKEKWEQYAPMLYRAYVETNVESTFAAVEERIKAGQDKVLLDVAYDMVVGVGVFRKEGAIFRIVAATHTIHKQWGTLMPLIERWAQNAGCERLRASGRKGWERAYKPFGFSPVGIIMEKSLCQTQAHRQQKPLRDLRRTFLPPLEEDSAQLQLPLTLH